MLLRRIGGEVEEALGLAAEGGDVFPLAAAQGIARGFEGLGDELGAGGLGAADIHLAHEGGADAGLDGAGPGFEPAERAAYP